MPEKPIKIFYSYSRKDLDMRNRLEEHLASLKQVGKISTWHDLELEAGTEWEPEILSKLDTADIILLLISRSFFNSQYCYSTELKRAITRHEAGTAQVIPIILRPCHWQIPEVPFSKLVALPNDSKAISQWKDRDEAFKTVAQRIQEKVDQLIAESQSTLDTGSASSNLRDVLTKFDLSSGITSTNSTDSPDYASDEATRDPSPYFQDFVEKDLSGEDEQLDESAGYMKWVVRFAGGFILPFILLPIFGYCSSETSNHNRIYQRQLPNNINQYSLQQKSSKSGIIRADITRGAYLWKSQNEWKSKRQPQSQYEKENNFLANGTYVSLNGISDDYQLFHVTAQDGRVGWVEARYIQSLPSSLPSQR